MFNETTVGSYFTGLVILTKAIPPELTDANGDQVRLGIMQCLKDASAELKLGREVNWDAEAEPADVVPISRAALKQLTDAAAAMQATLAEVAQ